MINSFETPILFIIFNRPETEQVVFNEIRKLKPGRLFVAADGTLVKEGLARGKNAKRQEKSLTKLIGNVR